MSEEAIKAQKRRLANAVVAHFSKTIPVEDIFYLDGNPFDLEFCDPFQTWKIRCVAGNVSQTDRDEVEKRHLNPAYFRKAIAFRPNESNKDFDLLEIK
jgi:hypothetical protein